MNNLRLSIQRLKICFLAQHPLTEIEQVHVNSRPEARVSFQISKAFKKPRLESASHRVKFTDRLLPHTLNSKP